MQSCRGQRGCSGAESADDVLQTEVLRCRGGAEEVQMWWRGADAEVQVQRCNNVAAEEQSCRGEEVKR